MRFARGNLYRRFGIRSNQDIVKGALVTSAYWYDERGHEVGSGDLSAANLWKISRQLKSGELFIVQPFANGHAPQEGWQKFLVERVAYIVVPGKVYELVDDVPRNKRKTPFTPYSRTDAFKLFPRG